jgi:lysophospholipase L1-like esterase
MKKYLIALMLLLAGKLSAQTTAVSATVVDSDGTTWTNGTWSLSFSPNNSFPNPNQYTINGAPLDPVILNQKGSLTSGGVLAITTYDSSLITPGGSGWNLTVCPNATAKCGLYTFSTAGAANNISASLTINIPPPRFVAKSGTYGYADGEAALQLVQGATYWNVTTLNQKTWTGTVWQASTGTVNAGTTGQIAYYPSNGTAVSGNLHFTDNGTSLALTEPLSVGTSLVDTVYGFNNPVPALLPNLRLGIANVLSQQADAKILFVGDSTTQGAGTGNPHATTVPNLDSYVWQLAKLMTAAGIPTQPGLTMACNGTGGLLDTRWVYGGDWTCAGFGFAHSALETSTHLSNIVFTPVGGYSYDRFDVYYLCAPGRGSLAITATGGSTTNVNAATCGTGVFKSTVSAASASTTNAVTIVPSTAIVEVVAIEPWLSTSHFVRLGFAGQGGSTTTDWNVPGSYYPQASIAAYAANAVFISLGINDAGASVSATTVQTNLNAIITAAKTTGDVILQSYPPSGPAGTYHAFEAVYYPFLQSIARTQNIAFVDEWGRFNGTYGGTNWIVDGIHPTLNGYWDWANLLRTALNF